MVYHQAKLFHYHPKRLLFTPESMMYCSPINHRLRANTWLNRRQYIIFSAPADYLFPDESVWRRMKPRFHTYFIVCLLLAKKWRHEGGFWFPNREKPKWTGLLCSWFFKNLPFHRDGIILCSFVKSSSHHNHRVGSLIHFYEEYIVKTRKM